MSPAKQNYIIQCNDSTIFCSLFVDFFFLFVLLLLLYSSLRMASMPYHMKKENYDRIIPLLLIWSFRKKIMFKWENAWCISHPHSTIKWFEMSLLHCILTLIHIFFFFYWSGQLKTGNACSLDISEWNGFFCTKMILIRIPIHSNGTILLTIKKNTPSLFNRDRRNF